MIVRNSLRVSAGLVLASVLAAASPASASDFVFVQSGVFNIEPGCYDVKTADLNADGRPDIVAAVYDVAKVAVLINDGTGGFPVVTPLLGPHPVAVDIADFNNDGKLDIAAANWDEGTFSLRLNTGGGAFAAPLDFTMGAQPRDLVSADFDGDGTRDVAVATAMGSVVVRRGLGGSAFAGAQSFAIGGALKGIAAADVDGDGRPDLLVVDANGSRMIKLRNTGAMNFVIEPPIGVGANPSDIALADLDQNGSIDAAVSTENGTVSVLLNNGSGTFGPGISFPCGNLSQSVAIADFNLDGTPDLLVSNYTQNSVTVLLGQGGGIFGDPVVGNSAGGLRSAAPADFNGDGRPDVVTGDFSLGTLHVLRNQLAQPATGPFFLEPGGGYITGTGGYDLRAVDLDQDGSADLLDAVATQNQLVVLHNTGTGSFVNAASYPTTSACAIDIADYNDDGKPDVAVAGFTSGTVSIRLNVGSGQLGPAVSYAMGTNTRDVVSADLDGDGFRDLATASGNGQLILRRGLGGTSFGPAITIFSVGFELKGIAAGDFNHDGRIDLVLADHQGGFIVPMRNEGGMTFTRMTPIVVGAGTSDVVLDDLNRDGELDLAAVNENGQVAVLTNAGPGTFVNLQKFPIGTLSQSVTTGDFDADGWPDLLVSNYYEHTVSVLVNRTDGQYTAPITGAAGLGVRSATAADFNHDGRLDVATCDDDGGSVHILFNRAGNPNPPPPPPPPPPVTCLGLQLATPTQPAQAIVVDLNGDGLLDVATANASGSASYFLREAGNPFGPRFDLPVGTAPNSVAAGDLTGDGQPELAVANDADNSVSLFKRGLGPTFAPLANLPVGSHPRYVKLVDLNGDGRLDIATVNDPGAGHDGSVTILFNGPGAGWNLDPEPAEPGGQPDESPPLEPGAGPPSPESSRIDLAVGPRPTMLATSDLDGDGFVDLVVGNDAGMPVALIYGMAPGRFHPAVSASDGGRWVDIGDLNGDGRPDLALASGNVLVLWNDATNPFTLGSRYGTDTGTNALTLGDINGDGKLDLAYVTEPGLLGTFAGNGLGTLTLGSRCGLGLSGRSIALAPRVGGGVDAYAAVFGNSMVLQRSFAEGSLAPYEPDSAGVAVQAAAPFVFGLARPAPNPAVGAMTVHFTMAADGPARLEVFDARGRLVRQLMDEKSAAGPHERVWDGTDASGARVRPGLYFYRLTSAAGSRVERQVVLGGLGP